MATEGSGAILFTGATSSIRGRAGALAFSSAKFAVRGLAWSLARELWPQGIHVAHIIIDGMLDTPHVRATGIEADEPLLDVDAVAQAYWDLTQQDKGAWAFEIDMRPHDEDFFG
jgi:NAD(P)-dependent dehydrogenase (short-subunit alcohol dehydrogenase family)